MCRGKTAFIIIHRNPAVVKKNFLFFQENRAPDFLLSFYLILCIFQNLSLKQTGPAQKTGSAFCEACLTVDQTELVRTI